MCFITIRKTTGLICRTLSQKNVNRGRVEEKRPTDEEIADYIENSEPVEEVSKTVLVVRIILDQIFFDFHDLLNVEYDNNSCRTINLNLVKIITFCVFQKSFRIISYYYVIIVKVR